MAYNHLYYVSLAMIHLYTFGICEATCPGRTNIAQLCKDTEVQGNKVYIDTVLHETRLSNCTCKVFLDTAMTQNVTVAKYPIENNTDIDFMSEGNSLVNRMKLLIMNGTTILYVRKTDKPTTTCLGLNAVHTNQVKLKCYAGTDSKTPFQQNDESSDEYYSNLYAPADVSEPIQPDTVTSSKSTTLTNRSTQEPYETSSVKESTNSDIKPANNEEEDSQSNSLTIGLIIGCVFIVFGIFVAIALFTRWKRRSGNHKLIASTRRETGVDNENYYMRENECYVSADLVTDMVQIENRTDTHAHCIKPDYTEAVYNEIDNDMNHLIAAQSNNIASDVNNVYNVTSERIMPERAGDLNTYDASCLNGDYNRLDEVIPPKKSVENIYNEASGSVL